VCLIGTFYCVSYNSLKSKGKCIVSELIVERAAVCQHKTVYSFGSNDQLSRHATKNNNIMHIRFAMDKTNDRTTVTASAVCPP
jgi:hypothetical protein